MASIDWVIKSIDVMGKSKDTMRAQVSIQNIALICTAIKELGSTHVAISCPLDEYTDYPVPQPISGYLNSWVAAARTAGLKVFFRGMWINFEGIYDDQKKTPTSTPSIALGTYTNVINGNDTTSYLYKSWNWIKTHGSLIQAGDIIGFCPEPESQGIGGATSDMFSSYTVMGQWLVDMKKVADHALTNTLGYTQDQVVTGMTSINGGTVQANQISSIYWSQIGRCSIDHYVPYATYSKDLDTIHTNAGVDIYINEWGTTAGYGGSLSDWMRYEEIVKMYALFNSKSWIKGVNYWQATSAIDAKENILDYQTFGINPSGMVIAKYYNNQSRISL